MAKIAQEIIDEILVRSDIVQVIGRYTQLRQRGRDHWGNCPFHNEKTPSFKVSSERGAFYCFGCRESGGVVAFLQKIESLTFPEVIQRLGAELGIEVRLEESHDPNFLRKKRTLELLERSSHYYHELLLRSPLGREAIDYLEQRGLERRTLERFRLGWAPAGGQALLQKLLSSGYQAEEGEAAGLLYQRQGRFCDMLRGRVVFPIFDIQDRVLAFGGRVLDQSQPKYLNTPETEIYSKRRNLYGLHLHRQEIARQDLALLVEGYLDVVSVSQVGCPITVASLGTALTGEQATLLRRFTRNVLLAYDADRAGQNATLKAIELFEEAGLRMSIAQLESETDPDSLARQQGKSGVEQMIQSAVSVVDYVIDRSQLQSDLSKPGGKEDFVKEVLAVLHKVRDPVARQSYIPKLARLTGVQEKVLLELLRPTAAPLMLSKKRGRLDLRGPEARLFQVCVAYPHWLESVRHRFHPDQLVVDHFRPLYQALWKLEVGERPVQLQDLLPHLEDSESCADLTELLIEHPPVTTAEDLDKLVKSLRDKFDLQRQEQLGREVRAGIEAGTIDPELYHEYLQLQRRLKGAR